MDARPYTSQYIYSSDHLHSNPVPRCQARMNIPNPYAVENRLRSPPATGQCSINSHISKHNLEVENGNLHAVEDRLRPPPANMYGSVESRGVSRAVECWPWPPPVQFNRKLKYEYPYMEVPQRRKCSLPVHEFHEMEGCVKLPSLGLCNKSKSENSHINISSARSSGLLRAESNGNASKLCTKSKSENSYMKVSSSAKCGLSHENAHGLYKKSTSANSHIKVASDAQSAISLYKSRMRAYSVKSGIIVKGRQKPPHRITKCYKSENSHMKVSRAKKCASERATNENSLMRMQNENSHMRMQNVHQNTISTFNHQPSHTVEGRLRSPPVGSQISIKQCNQAKNCKPTSRPVISLQNIDKTAIESSNIKVLSWNIHSLGYKIELPHVHNIISSHDIIFLSETWLKQTENLADYHINGYNMLNYARPETNIERNSPCPSGGILVYVKSEIFKQTSLVFNQCDHIVTLKVSSSTSSPQDDIYIIHAYLSPENTTFECKSCDNNYILKSWKIVLQHLPPKVKQLYAGT